MARPTTEDPTTSFIVPDIVRYAMGHDLGVAALGARFHLPADVATRESVVVRADVPNELLEALAQLREPHVALTIATSLSGRAHTLVDLASRACPTVGEMLLRHARWIGFIHEGLEASVSENRFALRTPRRPRGVGSFVHELALARALSCIRAAAGDDVAALRVWFGHPRPRDASLVRAFFGAADISFGQNDSGFELSTAALALPSRFADPHVTGVLEPMIEELLPARSASFAARARACVQRRLPDDANAEHVAEALHMSTRTLQRRLEQEQTSLSEVVDQARRSLAEKLLADPTRTLADVAASVGFSELSAFSRAFKRWTGKPPGQWRRS